MKKVKKPKEEEEKNPDEINMGHRGQSVFVYISARRMRLCDIGQRWRRSKGHEPWIRDKKDRRFTKKDRQKDRQTDRHSLTE